MPHRRGGSKWVSLRNMAVVPSLQCADESLCSAADAGVANTGFLPTNVTEMATKIKAVLPVAVEIEAEVGDADSNSGHSQVTMLDGYSPSRVLVGQLSGRLATRVNW